MHQSVLTPALSDLPVPERDLLFAETLAFMVERGYDLVAPGEPATVVRGIHVATDDTAGAAYIKLCDANVERTVGYAKNVNVDLGKDGQVIGVEILYPAKAA